MKKIVKIALFVIIAAAIAVYGYIYSQKPLEKDTLVVEPKDAVMYFIQQGQAVPGDAVSLYPLVSGEVVSVTVAEGDFVNKGDVICVVDSTDYQIQIQRSETGIKAYEAQKKDLSLNESREKTSLNASKNDLQAQLEALKARNASKSLSNQEQAVLQESVNKQLESNLEWAQSNFQKVSVLFEASAIPQQEYDQAKKQLEDAEKALEQGELTLNSIQSASDTTIGSEEYFTAMEASINSQISGINKNLGTSYTAALGDYYDALIASERVSILQLERQIENCEVKAPVSGKLETLGVKDTNMAMPGQPVAVIRLEKEIAIEVYVLTKDIVNISLGQAVDVIFRARDNDVVIPSKVIAIDNKAEEKISSLGVTEKKVKVTVQMSDNEIIKNGYDVDVKFTYYNEPDKVIVPKTALFKSDGKDMVWSVKDGVAALVEVEKGVELRGETVIESGLGIGDRVITDANDSDLKPGVKIQ